MRNRVKRRHGVKGRVEEFCVSVLVRAYPCPYNGSSPEAAG